MTSADRNDLLDHLVGAGEQRERERDSETERPGSFEIDDQLHFGGLLDRQIRRLRPAQNSLGDAC